MVENIPNLAEDINLLETKDKERIFKAAREKWYIPYKGKAIWIMADFCIQITGITRKGVRFSSTEKTRTVNPKFYIQRK